jgi:hypothetical protein
LSRGAHCRIAAAKKNIYAGFHNLRGPFLVGATAESTKVDRKISPFEKTLSP